MSSYLGHKLIEVVVVIGPVETVEKSYRMLRRSVLRGI